MDVRVGDRPVVLQGARQERTLATLLLDAGRVVTVDQLVDVVWDEPPASARRQIQDLVTRLRRQLVDAGAAPGLITTQRAGYLLEPGEHGLDTRAFEALAAAARRTAAQDPAGAVAGYREALSLWRGAFLAGIRGQPFEGAARIWQERRLAVVEECLTLELSLGRHHEVTAEALALVEQHPYRESLVELLMRALHGSGRLADALDVYRALRRRLADELGLDPGADLRRLHDVLLRSQAGAVPAAQSSGHVAAMLPPGVYGFAGRDAELARLDGLLAGAAEQPTALVVAAVTGAPGVGKTALAVHWAHRVRDRFPDGQLYLNLRGFDQSGQPMTPVEAVRVFLDALGVPAGRVPAGIEAQSGLYRSLLAGRRMLIVLDNARDAEQVRPLLPGAPGCLVLVTSRDQLSGLVAAEGAHPLRLDLLSVPEARELLARRLGGDRVAAEPGATAEIIERCARLPLALAVIAARAAIHPGFPLAAIAGELPAVHDSLDAFDADGTQLRHVFSWSHQGLSAAAGRMFRLLGLHPGPDLTLPAAAGLAGLPVERARPLLAELCRAHLLTEHAPGRYTFHDLLRAHAVELVQELADEPERRAATRRLLDHYLHAAHAAALGLNPRRDLIPRTPPGGGTAGEDPVDERAALAWFTAESAVLVAVICQAAAQGFDAHAWQLAWAVADFLDRHGMRHEQLAVRTAALAAARRAGGRLGQACAHGNLSALYGMPGRHRDALGHATQALTMYRTTGHLTRQARELNLVGWFHAQLGDQEGALGHCRQALDLHQRLGDRLGQANSCDGLGYASHLLGRHEEAVSWYRRAVELFREAGDRYHQADTLVRLGDSLDGTGLGDAAADARRQALALLEELGHPSAARLKARLTS
ncbi:BTAD domain-containing putative transcriptional regulator [Nonomuraea sp. NPDC001831]|uniref:AfsR/SARP family transcriptional regulator n=1 Tax=Nonomuraea sp. NPDC001831 TaxID=3364340 RepID=UPI00367C598E